jgi:hypothetical protein
VPFCFSSVVIAVLGGLIIVFEGLLIEGELFRVTERSFIMFLLSRAQRRVRRDIRNFFSKYWLYVFRVGVAYLIVGSSFPRVLFNEVIFNRNIIFLLKLIIIVNL